MKLAKLKITAVVLTIMVGTCAGVEAREPEDITDWYIKDFKTSITVNKDSSLIVIEDIVADAGNLPNKHGIFRILPTEIKTEKGTFKTPITLLEISDFEGKPRPYTATHDRFNKTITWKIGDPNITVTGENTYRIAYKVDNAVRFGNPDFDELYWNVLGNFWQIDIDQFSASIIFPEEVSKENAKADYYAGALGSKDKSKASYEWVNDHEMRISFTGTLPPEQGITFSVTFPKDIFIPYQPGFFEAYGHFLVFLLPLAVFLIAFLIWKKHGKDPKMRIPIPPEFGVPEKITPMQMGLVLSSGSWKDKLIAATIVDLAVRKHITIEETEEKVLFFTSKGIVLKKNLENSTNHLNATEKIIMNKFFSAGNSIKLPDLKKDFYKEVPDIKKSAIADAIAQGWVAKKGASLRTAFFVVGVIIIAASIFGFIATAMVSLLISMILSGIITMLFAIIMVQRTRKGTDLLFQIKGFERYMRQAEDYRQQFYEKENIFDKFLPYAMVFGITKLWAQKMEKIYGKDFYQNYHPIWYVGAINGSFNPDSFTSQINSIAASIAASTSTSSGSGGGGGAGGGGGGGGGGGW